MCGSGSSERSGESGLPPSRIGTGTRTGQTRVKGGAAGRRPSLFAADLSEPARRPQGIKVTERLFVVSVRVAEVNWTVIGGLHDGLNTAVAEMV